MMIYAGDKLIKENATTEECMDYIWDEELNTEEHPIRIVDENGNELEW